jgi:hypothetical protein
MKISVIFICLIGLAGLFYGMFMDNDIIFVAGISFVIAGYLMIRIRLKEKIDRTE